MISNHSVPGLREPFENALIVLRKASMQILALSGLEHAEGKDPQWFLQQLDVARTSLGSWAAIARELNLDDAEMTQFTFQLRHFQQFMPEFDAGEPVTRNGLIAALRLVSTLEYLREKQPLLTYSTALIHGSLPEPVIIVGRIYRLEALLKGIISQRWTENTPLLRYLKTLFGAEAIRRWLSRSTSQDILSAMSFSDLASLLVDKQEFERHYSAIYMPGTSLNFLIDQRKTLQIFLDDIRRIRNDLLAGHFLSPVQWLLLEHYSQEIITPVQRAWDERRSKINPSALKEPTGDQVKEFLQQAKTKADDGEEQIPVRESIERPQRKHHAPVVEEKLSQPEVILWGFIGAAATVMIIFVFGVLMEFMSLPKSRQITENSNPQSSWSSPSYPGQPVSTAKGARDTLNGMGINWDTNNLRMAIDRGDEPVVRLFLRGGMSWQLSWTDQALARDDLPVLERLLDYASMMNEPQPCPRMLDKVSIDMIHGQSLTAMRAVFLQTFCRTADIQEKQSQVLAQAQASLQAQQTQFAAARARGETPLPVDDRPEKIQRAIYNVLR